MFQQRCRSASPAISGHLAWAPKTSKQASVDVIRDVMMIHPLPPFQSLRRGPEGSRVFRLLGRLLACLSPLPSASSSVLASVPASHSVLSNFNPSSSSYLQRQQALLQFSQPSPTPPRPDQRPTSASGPRLPRNSRFRQSSTRSNRGRQPRELFSLLVGTIAALLS